MPPIRRGASKPIAALNPRRAYEPVFVDEYHPYSRCAFLILALVTFYAYITTLISWLLSIVKAAVQRPDWILVSACSLECGYICRG